MYRKKYVHLTDFVLIYHREAELADVLKQVVIGCLGRGSKWGDLT